MAMKDLQPRPTLELHDSFTTTCEPEGEAAPA
jgi:hypothetical protein